MAEQAASAQRLTGTPVRSYRTRFERDEDPVSEGGMWVNGEKDGEDWANVITRGGVAYGDVTRVTVAERRAEQGNLDSGDAGTPEGDYTDPTAVLSGSWGRNQHARGTVFSRNQTEEYFQEVELRLRSSITPRSCTGYEVFWRCLKNDNAYSEIVRWNGPVADFTSIARQRGPDFGVKDGDVVEATIIGAVITGYINGVEVISATDDTFTEGSPGIGFNFGVGHTNVDHGFRTFEVDTSDG